MKGCAISAVLRLSFYVAIVVALSFLFQHLGAPAGETWGPAIFSGLFAWIGLGFLFGIHQPLRERRMLARAVDGQPPIDGQIGVITGTIRAQGTAMRAPLSGVPCIAFQYEIFKEVGTGKRARKAVYYKGVALTPSTIRTNRGSYKLLAVPTFDFESQYLSHDPTVRRAKEHIRTATFEAPQAPFTRPALEKQWSDDDGSYRREVRDAPTKIDLETCSFSESVVKDGEVICVFGRYSAARGGIVADENWANETRIMKSDGATIVAALGQRVVRYIVFGLITCGVSIALAVFFLSNA